MIPKGSVVTATMTEHGLKDPDIAIKTPGIEPIVVAPKKEAVMHVIGSDVILQFEPKIQNTELKDGSDSPEIRGNFSRQYRANT